MGILLQNLNFKDMVVSEEDASKDVEMDDLYIYNEGFEDGLLSFYKGVVTGKLTYQSVRGFEQLEKDVIERYGEKRVKEYLES